MDVIDEAGEAKVAPAHQSGGGMEPPPSQPPQPAIVPLGVPWLRHDNFMTIKKVCSGEEGIMQAKKTSVVRVLQELKKGRTFIEQELAHLEEQLLHVSDFLGGAVAKLEITPVEAPLSSSPSSLGVDGEPSAVAIEGAEPLDGARRGKGKTVAASDKTNAVNPTATLVEEDLASDAPCTTVGLWRYLSHFSYSKTVTLQDMQEALLLEDPPSANAIDAIWDEEESEADDSSIAQQSTSAAVMAEHAMPMLDEMPAKRAKRDVEAQASDLLKMRLLASMVPMERLRGTKLENETETFAVATKNEEDVEMTAIPDSFTHDSWNSPNRSLDRLRDIGLIERVVTAEQVVRSLQELQDDEVSNEIRVLQNDLVAHVRRNNEYKRSLRRSLERLKPWLTHDDEIQQTEGKFLKMWRRKKELQRKKKHKAKKMMRKEASYKSAFTMPPLLPS